MAASSSFIAQQRARYARQSLRRRSIVRESQLRESLTGRAARLGYASEEDYLQAEAARAIQTGESLSEEILLKLSPRQRERVQVEVGRIQDVRRQEEEKQKIAQIDVQKREEARAAALQRFSERKKIREEKAQRDLEAHQGRTYDEFTQGFNVSLRTGELGRAETIQGRNVIVYKSADPRLASTAGAQFTPEYLAVRERIRQEANAPYNVSLRSGAVAQATPQGQVTAQMADVDLASPAPITAKEIKRAQAIQKELKENDRITRAIGSFSGYAGRTVPESILAPKVLPQTKIESKEILFGAGRTIASPFIGAGKIAKTTVYDYPRYLLGKNPEYKPLKGDPDVGALAFTSIAGASLIFPYTRPLVSRTLPALSAYASYKGVKEARSPYELGQALPIAIPAFVSGATKTKGLFQRLGKTKVPEAEVFDPQVLTGKATFPTARSIKESEAAFAKSKGEVVTAAPQRLKGEVAEPSRKGGKGFEDPGIYVSPKGRGSPYFLRTQPPPSQTPSLSLNPFAGLKNIFKTPTVTEFKTKGVRRYPREVIEQPGFKAVEQFQTQTAGQGFVFISKRSEIGLGSAPRQGELSTRELEAVIPVGQRFVERPSKLYTTFQGDFVRYTQGTYAVGMYALETKPAVPHNFCPFPFRHVH